MLLTKLEVYNFGPYKQKIELQFKKEGSRSLWILWGKNGAGKTHIFKAIKWCLYGWDPAPTDKSRYGNEDDAWHFINGTHVADYPENARMHVFMWLEDERDGKIHTYLLKRWIVPLVAKPRNPSQIKVDFEVVVDGITKGNSKEIVETDILPVAASQFFMFHGEDLRHMSQRHMEKTQQAIELIIDAETFRQGSKDANYIARQILEPELDIERQKLGQVDDYLAAKKQVQDEINRINDSVDATKRQLDEANKELQEVTDKLKESTESQSIIVEIEEKTRYKNSLEESLARNNERILDSVNVLPQTLLLPQLKDVLKVKEERHLQIVRSRRELDELRGTRHFLAQLDNDEECVCGRSLTSKEKSTIHAKVEALDNHIAQSQGNTEEEDPTYYAIREIIAPIEQSNLDLESLYSIKSKTIVEIDEVESAIRKLEKAIAKLDKEEIRNLTRKRESLLQQKGGYLEVLSRLESDLTQEKGYIEKIDKNLQSAQSKPDIVRSLETQLEIARALEKSFDFVREKLVEMRRSSIERHATEIFRHLTNKPDEYAGLTIDEEYNISVLDRHGKSVQRETLSTGEREVVALSFVLGLMRASEKKAPLVLDTFFVHLDQSHYANIVRALPSFAQQVLLILTDLEYKNLTEKAPAGFFDHVNEVWKVSRISEEEETTIASGAISIVE